MAPPPPNHPRRLLEGKPIPRTGGAGGARGGSPQATGGVAVVVPARTPKPNEERRAGAIAHR